ncbi:hypothetical protein B0H66DRAFT_538864 [Apodospora peruviana]|uniref:Uncharacterized protein n=1 Tax=Apodospora peruviana TaxID=516989 RepID=A0AAE0HU07_9PEZI|nr:hypothetical protein B0H66DRAFT_538864 [Apodospora peruviana]
MATTTARTGVRFRSYAAKRPTFANDAVDELAPDEVTLSSHRVPTLAAGTYRVKIEQGIAAPDGKTDTLSTEQQFVVQAPQLRLDPNLPVTKLQPRPLPHIVFNDPELPLERSISNTSLDSFNRIPWTAVLTFAEEELHLPPEDLTKWQGSLKLQGDPATAMSPIPGIEPSFKDREMVECLVLRTDLFKRLFGSYPAGAKESTWNGMSDLGAFSYLAHVRGVHPHAMASTSPGDTELQLPVVIGHRVAPFSLQRPTMMISHVVSLEGVENLTWSGGGPKYVGLDTLLNSSAPAPAAKQSAPDENASWLLARLRDGYLLKPHTSLSGSLSTVLFRGPLTPTLPVLTAASVKAWSSAGNDLDVQDCRTGLIDASYRAAWQLGRLLALADAAFNVSLLRLRGRIHTETSRQVRQESDPVSHDWANVLGWIMDLLFTGKIPLYCQTFVSRRRSDGRPTRGESEILLLRRIAEAVILCFTDRIPGETSFTKLLLSQPGHQQGFALDYWVDESHLKMTLRALPKTPGGNTVEISKLWNRAPKTGEPLPVFDWKTRTLILVEFAKQCVDSLRKPGYFEWDKEKGDSKLDSWLPVGQRGVPTRPRMGPVRDTCQVPSQLLPAPRPNSRRLLLLRQRPRKVSRMLHCLLDIVLRQRRRGVLHLCLPTQTVKDLPSFEYGPYYDRKEINYGGTSKQYTQYFKSTVDCFPLHLGPGSEILLQPYIDVPMDVVFIATGHTSSHRYSFNVNWIEWLIPVHVPASAPLDKLLEPNPVEQPSLFSIGGTLDHPSLPSVEPINIWVPARPRDNPGREEENPNKHIDPSFLLKGARWHVPDAASSDHAISMQFRVLFRNMHHSAVTKSVAMDRTVRVVAPREMSCAHAGLVEHHEGVSWRAELDLVAQWG